MRMMLTQVSRSAASTRRAAPRRSRRAAAIALAALAALGATAAPAAAQERHWRQDDHRDRGDRHDRDDWRGGDIHRFHEHDFERWRAGSWRHGRHAGRAGWWWVVGNVWYFYPAPVYPFPDPYQPPVVIAPSPAVPQAPAVYYYCDNPAGYYPYVPQCFSGWRAIPAAPPR
jgi:hypothetical protein